MPLSEAPDQVVPDPAHSADAAYLAYDHGRMDAFDTIPGAVTLGVNHAYTQMVPHDIPAYWAYARHFTLDDHFFSTIMGPSFPNHLVFIAAQNGGVTSNPQLSNEHWGCDAPPGTFVSTLSANGKAGGTFPCFDFATLADCERIESGLLSYGGDTDDQTNPFEVRLDKYVDLDVADDAIGIQALRRIQTEGPRRHKLGLVLEGAEPPGPGVYWLEIRKEGRKIGDLTTYVWSWHLERIIGFALIARDCRAGETVEVITEGRRRTGTLTAPPFL